VKDNLTVLVDLQKVDQELQQLEALKGDLPQQLEKIIQKMSALTEIYGQKKVELSEALKNKAISEVDLESFQQKLTKYKEQLYAVTSNREYDAITLEIESVNEKMSGTEDVILELIEKEETLVEEIKNIEPELEALAEAISQKEKELATKIKATEVECKNFELKRVELCGKVIRSVLYQYERIRKGLGNNVVSQVINGACEGCRSNIPPQKQMEVRMMNQLILCEHCGRIMVSRPVGEPVID